MRKLTGWLVLLLLAPALAFALPDVPYDVETMLYYPRLTRAQQEVFDLLYAACVQGETHVVMPRNTSYDDACAAMDAVMDDCPELCALGDRYVVGYTRASPEIAEYIQLEYRMPVERQAHLVRQARALADGAYGDEFQREWYLHDLLCGHVTYDLTADHRHNAWGALMEGRAVCDGYAKAMTLLARISYLQCGVIHGQALADGAPGDHAWNIIKISGAHTLLDVTFNDQDQAGMISYAYFNLTDTQMNADHMPENAAALPACYDGTVNWHERRGLYVSSHSGDLEQKLLAGFRQMAETGAPLHLRFERREDYAAFADDPQRWMNWYNAQAGFTLPWLTGRTSFYYVDAQNCVMARPAGAD